MQAQLTHLPAPVKDTQGNYNTIYFLYFPPGVHIMLGNAPSCAAGGFCAYHASSAGSLFSELPYGVFPDFGPTSGCGPSKGCGNNTSANNLTSATSHELGEAVTDENIANANNLAPPLAWFSNTSDEIGDICNQDQQQITVGTHTYIVQALYSNMQNNCVTAPAQLTLTPPTDAIPGVAFNLTVAATSSFGSTVSNYSNTIHFTSSDAQAVLPADYTFVPGTDQGTHTFSVTLNTLNSQTITATDTLAAPITGTATVNVSHNPDLTIAKSHTGNFSQGQIGAHYMLTVGNVGDIATAGIVTVTDSLPPYLTATAMAGPGWTCVLGTLTCTRSDALAAKASYPAITLTVNVSFSAGISIINVANVSGGGEKNLTNDQANDPTTVVVFADLVTFLSDSSNFSQGAKGVQYTVIVQNYGAAPTTGLVNLTAALGSGLTATTIAGNNWSCALATLRCSRSDSLPSGSQYDPILVTLNVALNAPSSVTSTSVVSGGGEVNTSNDTATDTTPVAGPSPDFIIASTHTGSFMQGQTGATFQVTVSNVGVAASSGTVTASDSPYIGFTMTAISGTGWACTVASSQCTRSDALAPASSYPPIIVTVDVSPTAPPTAYSTANVSGGGEINLNNDSAVDTVNIIQLADMVASSFHSGSFGQGQRGATYTLTATNAGGSVSSGTITLADTLPAGLTATAMSGTGWTCTLASLTCTTNAVLAPSSTSTPVTLTVNVDPNAAASLTNTVMVAGGGEVNTGNDTFTDPTQIVPGVFVTLMTSNSTVTAGQPASYTFSISSFAPDAVVLSCKGLPALATCSFNPASITGQGASTTLTITTTVPTRSAAQPALGNGITNSYILLLPLAGLLMIGSRRKARLALSGALLGIVFLAGCGGSSSAPKILQGGTPAGSYTITITAADAGATFQGTTTVPLNVNWNGL